MIKDYLVGVTDGTAWCHFWMQAFADDLEAEDYLLQRYEEHGPRPFWMAAKRKTSIDSFQRLCRIEPKITGYLLDGEHWAKYFYDGEKYVWKDIS